MARQAEEKKAKNSLLDKLIQGKISEAHNLFALWGEALRLDPLVGSLLESLGKKIAASWEVMEASGVSLACKQCMEEDGCSCCGAGIENRYTSRLLLINLLLGKSLTEKRFWENSCFFLTENGCSLKARLVLCVNYLCLKIQRLGAPEELTRLQNITGEEMDESFILEEAVKRFIEKKTYGKQGF